MTSFGTSTHSPSRRSLPQTEPQQEHQHHHQQQEQQTGADIHQYAMKRRIRLFVLSLALCCAGLTVQISNLRDFQKSRRTPTTDELKSEDPARQLNKGYFAPSLDYRYRGRSSVITEEELNILQQACNEPVKDLHWEFYGQNLTTNSEQTTKLSDIPGHDEARKKKKSDAFNKDLMIGLFSGYDQYAKMMSQSALMGKLYATKWPETDLVVLQGTAFAPQGCQPPGFHTTLNKIRLLFYAIDHGYKQVLLMEADTILVDMDFDVTKILGKSSSHQSEDSYLLAAQESRSSNEDADEYQVNAGVTIWNLQHPKTKAVALAWLNMAKADLVKGRYNGDGKYLQDSLRENKAPVKLLPEEFHFHRGTVVQHFLRKSVKDRLKRMQLAAKSVCEQYPGECDGLYKEYPTE